MFFWYSKKMHEHLSGMRVEILSRPFGNVLKLPDGKIATAQTKDKNHSMEWDDVTFLGEYDTCTVVPSWSVIPACNCKSWHRPRPPYDGISVTLKWEENEKYNSYDLTLGPLKFAEVVFSPGGNCWYVYIVIDVNGFKYVGDYNYLDEAKERAEQLVKAMI